MSHLKMTVLRLIAVAVLVTSVAGQMPESAPVVIGGAAMASGAPGPRGGMVTMRIEDFDAEPVKGAPFCATITTEHTQTFSDGNRIHTTENSTLCRDSEGHTRREASLNLLGAATQNSAPKLITIMDPVAGFRYMLDNENKIAHRMAILSPLNAKAVAGNEAGTAAIQAKGEGVMFYQRVGTEGPNMVMNKDVFFKKGGEEQNGPAPKSENLGDESIDGIHATGTRITTTIPAGKMGNEQPISVTSERWYSPELKVTVMTKHTDPWAGELKTQLTNVNTSEPDSSLFVVPSDYKVMSEKPGHLVIQKQLMAPPPPQ